MYIRPTAMLHLGHAEAREVSNCSMLGSYVKCLVSPNLGVEVAENVAKTVCVHIKW